MRSPDTVGAPVPPRPLHQQLKESLELVDRSLQEERFGQAGPILAGIDAVLQRATRASASARETQPRSTPTASAERPKPTEAMLAIPVLPGQRSRMRP